VSIIQENDLWKTWFNRLKSSDTVKEISRFHKHVYVRASGVGPIADRDIYLDGRGFDLLEKSNAVVIVAREVADAPAPENGAVRLKLISGGAVIVPVSEEVTNLVLIACADPNRNRLFHFLCGTYFCFSIKFLLFRCGFSIL
jgi:hypothetical protein